MGFGHEKLDVYRTAIEYVGWAYRFCESLKGHRNAKDQLKLGQRGYAVNEDQAQYTVGGDPDTDTDPDAEGNQEQTDRQRLQATIDSAPQRQRSVLNMEAHTFFNQWRSVCRSLWNETYMSIIIEHGGETEFEEEFCKIEQLLFRSIILLLGPSNHRIKEK